MKNNQSLTVFFRRWRWVLCSAAVLLVSVMIGFNNAILAESGMSYLGIGVQAPDASLGMMLSDAQGYLQTAPWYALFPGLAIVWVVLGFSLLGEGIRKWDGSRAE